MSTANPFHFIGGLFLEFGAAAAAIAVLWPTRPAEVVPPQPEWSVTQPLPFTPQPVYFQEQTAYSQPQTAARPFSPPAPRSVESDRYLARTTNSSEYRQTEPLFRPEPAPRTVYSQQPSAYAQQPTAVARPRIRAFANEQYSPTPAYRTAERLNDNYHTRY